MDVAIVKGVRKVTIQFTYKAGGLVRGQFIRFQKGKEVLPTFFTGGFQSWLDATKKEAAAANAAAQAVETEKKKEDKQQTYRSKEQRAKAAQQRARMRQLEQQSEAMQAELDALNEEITKEEVYSDFNLMQEKCKRMDTLRTELYSALEDMILFEEELG